MGEYHSTFKDGAFPTPSIDPSVPITHPGGEALASPFKDGNVGSGSGGGVTIPPGLAIGNLTQGPLASPMKDGVMSGKNKG